MQTILVDDERWGLERFEIECANMPEIEVIGKFQNAEDARLLAQEQRVDLALLDIQMPKMNGMDLSDELRELYPDIIIIFASAYEQYFKEAMKNRKADYFLLKPYTGQEVLEVLERARLLSARQKKRVRINTFGSFEIYIDDIPVGFTSEKAKELLAILVDHAGEPVGSETAFGTMWPNLPFNHTEAGRYRKALSKLQHTLMDAGIENILAYFPHARAIRKDMVECDYFDLLAETPQGVKAYNGNYMTQYSWAEMTVPALNKIKLRYDPQAEESLYE